MFTFIIAKRIFDKFYWIVNKLMAKNNSKNDKLNF